MLDGVSRAVSLGLADPSTLSGGNRAARDYHDHYSFDLTGNRLAKTTDLGNDGWVDSWTSSEYDANDRLQVEGLYEALPIGQPGPVDVSQQTVYEYDQTQQTKKTLFNGPIGAGLPTPPRLSSLNFSYDLQGRPAIATSTTFDGTTGSATHIERTTYDYDHTGIRVSATTDTLDPADGTTVQSTERVEFLNDPQNFTGYSQVIRETHRDGSGQLTEEVTYTFGLDELSQTTVTFENGQANSPITVTFAHDGHGSVRALLDAAGAIATLAGHPGASAIRQLFTYDAYGNAIGFDMAAAITVLLYSGEKFDQRLMMQYLRERPYDFATGRFIGRDPFTGNVYDPQSFHKYLYVHGNPISGIDPSGWSFTLSELFATITSGSATRGAKAAAAFQVYDKFDTAKDAMVFLSKIVRGQPWDITSALFLAIQFLPFGGIVKKIGGLLKKVPIGTVGKIARGANNADDVLDELTKVYKVAGAGTKGAAELVGVQATAMIAAGKGWKVSPFKSGYHGIDGIFQDQAGNWIIAEAKGGGSGLVGNQMSQTWIKDRVGQILNAARNSDVDDAVKHNLQAALQDVLTNPASTKLRGMVVKAPIDASGAVKEVEFLEKAWNNIGSTLW